MVPPLRTTDVINRTTDDDDFHRPLFRVVVTGGGGVYLFVSFGVVVTLCSDLYAVPCHKRFTLLYLCTFFEKKNWQCKHIQSVHIAFSLSQLRHHIDKFYKFKGTLLFCRNIWKRLVHCSITYLTFRQYEQHETKSFDAYDV